MTLTEAGKTFAAVVARVQARQETTLLLKKGKPVARIVPVGSKAKTGRKLAVAWPKLRHLSVKEATALEADLIASRQKLPPLRAGWE